MQSDVEEVERVAKAIYEADDPWSEAFPWPTMGSKEQSAENYRRIAKAAIEAMNAFPKSYSPQRNGYLENKDHPDDGPDRRGMGEW